MLSFLKIWEVMDKWVAIGLQDGSVDSSLYDTRIQAASHQHGNESTHFYFRIGTFAQGLKLIDAECLLLAQRDAYDAGMRFTDAMEQQDLLISTERGDIYRDMALKGMRSA
jgi:hypothetical protein